MGMVHTVKERALALGFDLVGVAPPAAWNDLEFAQRWLEKGYGGEMRYLANPKRTDPRCVVPSVNSIICLGLIYNTPHLYSAEVLKAEGNREKPEGREQERELPEPKAWISRYAWGQDYHEVMRPKLEELRKAIEALRPKTQARAFVDTGPIVERAFARYSGIGWMGKNTCLINEQKGSWFFLGVLLTSLELEPDLPAPDRCGSCTRCLEACPTGALVEPYVMDASRCISYFTIELKGAIPKEYRPAIGMNVFGCDICQDVCPWNSSHRAAATHAPEFQPLQVDCRGEPVCSPEADGGIFRVAPGVQHFSLFNPPLESLASLTEEDFGRLFARSPVKRAIYQGWLRNLCVAMGNSADRRFISWLERACQHPAPIIREHAAWALERLGG